MPAVNALPIVLISMVLLVTVPSTVQSRSCKSNKFDFCENLPALHSQLRYNYNATNASLSIEFIATPSKPGGWISWAINPTGTGMVGAQAFVAYELNGSLRTKTLNIAGYKEFHVGNLSFAFWDVSAKKKHDVVHLFASLAVPGNKTVLNQVWNVGPGATADGKILPHASDGESLQAKSQLSLTGAPVVPAQAPAPTIVAPAPATSVVAPAPAGKSSSGRLREGLDLVLIWGFVASMLTVYLF